MLRITSVILSLAEHLLLAFSRAPQQGDYTVPPVDNPLGLLESEYPDFREMVAGKRVLDFGCGFGHQATAIATNYGAQVTGLDTNPKAIEVARQQGGNLVRFTTQLTRDEQFDLVISQNSMEHYPEPAEVLQEMIRVLKPGGRILMTFGPPWYAPYGSHMYFFCRLPWLNILFPERIVMTVRKRYRNDGATHYEEVESGLNKMSLRKFERLVQQSGLNFARLNYRSVKGLDFLVRLPIVRELFCNRVTVVLD